MGNFSNDPRARLAESAGKQYVGVRMQQAVPVLDADWNLLEDLRRFEAESLAGGFIADGVPTGSDAFRIFSIGQPNDFGIRRGTILVAGKLIHLNVDFRYTTQPNFNNPAVIPLIAPLTTPGPDIQFVVYLETWETEVNSLVDPAIMDNRIGVETAIRLKREWAVRVVRLSDFPGLVAALPSGHFVYPLAQLNRASGNSAITDDMIVEMRDTDASPRREIAYRRGQSEIVLVDTAAFLNTITTTRDNVSALLLFLMTRFVDPATPFFAAEVLGMDVLRTIASLADHGIALVNVRALDTRAALKFYSQLLDAENRFVTVWKNAVLPLVKPAGKIYGNEFQSMVQTIETFLTGPAPAGFLTITDALQRGNLLECQRSQDQVNLQFGSEISKPSGFLLLTYLGSTSGNITKSVPFSLRYRVSGSVTPVDSIQVDRFIDPEWKTELRNGDASLPFNVQLGPGTDSKEFLVNITPSNSAPAQTALSLRAFATHNAGGLQHISGQIALAIGSPPPASGDAFTFSIATTNLSQVAGVFQIPAGSVGNMNFRLSNTKNSDAQVSITFAPLTQTGWVIKPPTGVDLTNQTIPAQNHSDYLFQFLAPSTAGQTLVFALTAKDSLQKVLAETQVTLTTT